MASSFYLVNGTNALIMPGTIIPYVGATAPNGWAICDGSGYSPYANPLLHAALGQQPSSPYLLPNLAGLFLRGSGFKDNIVYNGGTVRTFQSDDVKKHNHPITDGGHVHSYNRNKFSSAANTSTRPGGEDYINDWTDKSFTGITLQNSGTRTIPYCYGVNYIIKLDDKVNIVNSNFTSPALTPNSFNYFGNLSTVSTDITGWMSYGAVIMNNSTAWGYPISYPLGSQAMCIQGQAYIYQENIYLLSGTQYTLSFYTCGRPQSGTIPNTVKIDITLGAGTPQIIATHTPGISWSLYTQPFNVVATGLYKLTFTGTIPISPGNDAANAYQGISITY
jgi:microcystin-dependent protein